MIQNANARCYDPGMSVVVFLRGVNVGGRRTFRPSILVRELSAFDVVNVGAAGTFVVRKPSPQAKLLAAIQRKLPFETEIMLLDGRELVRLETDHLFGARPVEPGVVRFVSVLSKRSRAEASMPITLPPEGPWLMRLIASRDRIVFGEYRRQLRTIGYLGKIDKLLGVTATTRNWNTIMAIVRILKGEPKQGR